MVNGALELRSVSETHQAFRTGVDDADEQEADWKPVLSILNVKIPKGYYSQSFDGCNAGTTNS